MDLSVLAFILIVFPIFFISLWLFVCWILSHVGGWHRLSQSFTTTEKPDNQCLNLASIRVGFINYNHCTTLCFSSKGLFISVLRIFRVGHPPLLIPWYELNNPRIKQFLWKRFVIVDVGLPKIVSISLPESVYKQMNLMKNKQD